MLMMGVIQPVIWLFLFGQLFHKIIDIPGFGFPGSYLAYLIPGIVAMNAMSGNMWAGMAMIEEIDRGTLNRFLVTPASRLAIMNASVAEQAVSTVVQTLLIVVLGWAGGALTSRRETTRRGREQLSQHWPARRSRPRPAPPHGVGGPRPR
jgi:ABC-2 type transport system permease protein